MLVTGAAGFIGSHYVRTLLGGGYPGFEDAAVTVLDKLTYAANLAAGRQLRRRDARRPVHRRRGRIRRHQRRRGAGAARRVPDGRG
jgi:dTDP-D-glucose 4,6-dehydratase